MRKFALLSGLILGCASAAVEPSHPTPAAPVVRSSDAAPCSTPTAAAAQPGTQASQLRLRLRPVSNEAGGIVDVALTVTGPASALRSWRAPQLAGALDVRVTLSPDGCAGAPVTQQLHVVGGELLALSLPQQAATVTLRLEYTVPPQPLAPPHWRLEPNWFLAYGRRLLLLPADRGWSADVQVEIDPSSYGEAAGGVSSLGLAQRSAPEPIHVTVPALEQTLFAAGWLGSAVFDAPEGHDEAAWFGSTLFDVRLMAAEVASFRTAVREVLHDATARPLTLLLMADLEQGFEARRAPISVLVRVAASERLAAGLRLEVLQQVIKEWIGGQLSVQEDGVEPLWFGEGLSRYLARELALEFGLITPEEFAADINSLMAMQAVLAQHECTHTPAKNSATDAAAKDTAANGTAANGTAANGAAAKDETAAEAEGSSSSCARVLEAARGILHATELDTALRAQRSSLIDVLTGLLRRGGSGALSPSDWRAALESAGGSAEKKKGSPKQGSPAVRAHEAFLAAGARPLLLPSNVFGPCFVREPTRFVESRLSFVLERSAEPAAPLRVTAVDPASPAEVAGLRPDTLLRRIEHVPYDPRRSIRLTLQDGLILEYRGSEARVPGFAWRRVPGVKDERCRMSGRGNPSAR
ncbi:MAG: hypothetical protein RL685_6499 [Pseudomonadota bacterium]